MRRRENSFAYHLAQESWLPVAVRHARTDLGAGVQAGRAARDAIAADFGALIDPAEQDTLKLLVTELVNNAVTHGQASVEHHVTLYVAVAPERIRAEVCDAGPGLDPQDLPRRDGRPGGKGFVILDGLASRWGVSIDDSTCVWFELDR